MPGRRDNSASSLPPSVEDAAVLDALAHAPEDDEPETAAEQFEAAAARRELAGSNGVSTAEIRRILAIDDDHS